MLRSQSRFFFLIVAWLLAFPLAAQVRPALVTGTVRTATELPIEYATVTLLRATDSVVVKADFTDVEGHFRLEPVPAGRYLVSVAQIGFTRVWAGPLEVADGAVPPLAFILQASAATQLQGVTVTERKPLFEKRPDRTVVNVEGSSLAAGNTTLDVLGRSPGMSVDGNDNLSLRGRQGLLVQINGKRIPLTGAELADYLRALPAEQVSTIELITNPSAKYDAQGGAGIIAINLKKDQRMGANGSANISYGRGRYGKFNTGLSLNYRQKNLNVYGSYAYLDRQNYQLLTFDRKYFDNDALLIRTHQRNDVRSNLQSHTWKAGLDYTVNQHLTLGAMLSGLANRYPSTTQNVSEFFNSQSQSDSLYSVLNKRAWHTPNGAANFTLRYLFTADSLGAAELTADADMARYTTDRQQRLTTTYNVPSRAPRLLTGQQDGTLTIQSAKVDYTRPMRHHWRLEVGGKASKVQSVNDLAFVKTVNGNSILDPDKSNHFQYDENINAAYLNFGHTLPGFTLNAGLRAEQTNATGRQETDKPNADFDRHYLQLFPNLNVSRKLNKNHELGLSLSRRLDRPTYNQLNPFRFYIDATSYRAGNPLLKPQASYRAEVTHTFRQKIVTSLSYAYTDQPFVSVYVLDSDRLVRSTDVNLKALHNYSLSLTAPLEPTKWWKFYGNAELFFANYNGSLLGSVPPTGKFAVLLSANNSLQLGKTWTADVNASYESRQRYAFLTQRSFGQLAVGVQKSVYDGRGTLRLNATDVLHTNILHATSRYTVFEEIFNSSQDTRVVTLSFSYRFGNDKVAPTRKRTTGAEDEKRRAAGQ
ncbi:outer membrane beta-barrel protein [Hymenobacter sp. BT491]|uniref:outer membrane beta-barrel protein n=1 Tax=Hymenobacter sp. BT491 TaxID=2766779 RepID=UPI0016534D36|nr:outer membrane beta-barrel protein [Hymenobacter sp. BT491]MBC6991705.1 outer membrane beta-barrel protein [Hymenobacter sp. BT491]